MARLRYDNSLGLLGAALGGTGADTTVTFAVAPAWSTLANGDYIPLIIDPPGASPNGNYEVVYVTAYVAGALTATIKRAQGNTARVAHANGATWMVAPTANDFPGAVAYPRQVTVYGHSYATGSGLVTAGVAAQNRQSTRLAQALGALETNYGVGGCCLCFENASGVTGVASSGGWPTVLANFAPAPSGAPYESPLGLVHLLWGLNDYCMFDTGAHFKTVFQAVLQGVIDRLRCAKVFEDSDASVTYPTGGWSSSTFGAGTVCSGTTMHKTASPGPATATVQIALPADYNGEAVVCGLVINGGAGANWSTVAGCTVTATDHTGTQVGPTVDMTAIYAAFKNATSANHNPFCTLRIPAGALAAGAQNITLTYNNAALNGLWFDWWGIEADNPPPILLEAPFRLPAAGYTALGTSRPYTIDDTGIANILAALNAVANLYTDGRVIVAGAGADAVINKQTSYLTSDNVHPNVKGAGIVALYEYAGIASWLADNPQEALNLQKDQIGPNLGQLTVARAYTPTPTGSFINGWNKINVNTLSFDPGSCFDLTNHRYICPSDGYYSVKGQVLLSNQASDSNYLALYVNGTRVSDGECTRTSVGATGTLWGLTVDDIVQCKKGDYIELFFNTANTTAGFMAATDSNNNYLSVVRVA